MVGKMLKRLNWLILLTTALAIGWYFTNSVKPAIIEASCADIAERSSNLYKRRELDPYYTFENTKARCIEETSRN